VALTGCKEGFQAEVRQVAPHLNIIHCIIHREALALCDLQPQLCTMLQVAGSSIVEGNSGRPRNHFSRIQK
jgi:hypothetical protein